jgi:hypothetical protein
MAGGGGNGQGERVEIGQLVELTRDQILVELHIYESILFTIGVLLAMCWHRGAIARDVW